MDKGSIVIVGILIIVIAAVTPSLLNSEYIVKDLKCSQEPMPFVDLAGCK